MTGAERLAQVRDRLNVAGDMSAGCDCDYCSPFVALEGCLLITPEQQPGVWLTAEDAEKVSATLWHWPGPDDEVLRPPHPEGEVVTIKEIIDGGTEAAFTHDGMVAWASLDAYRAKHFPALALALLTPKGES